MDQKKRTYSAAKLVGRVIQYMLHYYKYLFLLVVLCILITAVCTVVGATFPQTSGGRLYHADAKDRIPGFYRTGCGLKTAGLYHGAWRDHCIYL